ncbi:MAG: hypothetical protein ACLRR1_06670 [Alistipes shahii]|uniref:hypothetical protein n=1 Tax=Alistipes shahii TaxID=328814 RepID=UPI0039907E81
MFERRCTALIVDLLDDVPNVSGQRAVFDESVFVVLVVEIRLGATGTVRQFTFG